MSNGASSNQFNQDLRTLKRGLIRDGDVNSMRAQDLVATKDALVNLLQVRVLCKSHESVPTHLVARWWRVA